MAEAAPVQQDQVQGIPQQSREEIAARHAGYIGAEDTIDKYRNIAKNTIYRV